MIVRESLDFERGGPPLRRLDIGVLTWEKLKPGNILQNKKTVFPIGSRLYFSPNEDTDEDIRPNKYWIIKTIRDDNTWDGNPGLEIEFVWAGIFRHALSMAERIKQPGDLKSKNLPNSYTANKSIEEWNDYFKVLQPKNYELEESINFERGQEPKQSMDIGLRTWENIKMGDILLPKKEIYTNGKGIFQSSESTGDTIWENMAVLVFKVQKFYNSQEAKHIIHLEYFKCWDLADALGRRKEMHTMIPTRRMYGTRTQMENRFKILQRKDES